MNPDDPETTSVPDDADGDADDRSVAPAAGADDDLADEAAFEAFAHREFMDKPTAQTTGRKSTAEPDPSEAATSASEDRREARARRPRRRRSRDDGAVVDSNAQADAGQADGTRDEESEAAEPGVSIGAVLRIGAIVLVVAFIALLVLADRAIRPQRSSVEAGAAVQQAWFCPTTPGGPQIESEVTVASMSDRPVQAQVQFAPVAGDLPAPLTLEVPRNGASGVTASEVMPGPGGAIVTTPNADVAVGVKIRRPTSGRASGVAAYSCTRTTSERWTVAIGSTAKGQVQRLHILNPFRDDAVVKVAFGIRDGQETGREAPPETQGFVIRPGRSIDIEVGQFVIRRESVATELVAERGRVVLAQSNQPENRDGLAVLVGTPAPSRTLFFPGVRNSGGFGASIAVWNPSEASLVDIESSAQVEPEQAPVAVQQTQVQPVTRLDLDLRDLADGAAPVSLALRGDKPFVADEFRTSSSGIASVRPAEKGARRWIVPWTGDAVAAGPLEIQNPTSTEMKAVVHQLTPQGGDLVPLGDPVVIPPGNRVAVVAKDRGATAGASALAVVLDGPGIVGHAFAESGDLASDTAVGLE